MCIDESNRKNKFHQVAEGQETKIKDYVSSLNSLIASNINNGEDSVYSSRLPNTTSMATTPTISSILNNLLSSTGPNGKKHVIRSPELSYEALPLVASNLLLTSTKPSVSITSTTAKTTIKKTIANVTPQIHLDDNVDCCDVKISYWYQEDSIQNLLIQSLMLILITSRWLITRAELNLNQRSLILVISIATGADTIDFFSYLNLELVYQNDYLLYSTLLILSLSLLQFVFLHVEDSLNLTSNTSNLTGSNSNFSISNSVNNSTNEDSADIIKGKNSKSKKPRNVPFFYKQYLLFKNHLKPSSTNSSSSNSPLKKKIETKDVETNDPKNSNAVQKTDRKLIKINLPTYNRVKKQNNHHAIVNGFPLHKNSATKYFCYLFCCCIEQKDPLFFILLAGLFLHDGSYLTFRIFILSKLGWETTLNQSPSLVFFMVKNLFVIATQIYKVYTVTSERRQRKFYENYRDFVFATQQDNYAAAVAAAKQNANSNSNNNNNKNNNISNSTNNLNNLNNYQQNFNVALAAATGGQVPLVPINSFPTYPYPNQHLFLNQHLYQPATSNPYRFAQLYTDARPLGYNAMRRSLSPGNRINNRSVSTLGSVNTNLFCENLNSNNKNKKNKKNKNNSPVKNQKSKAGNNPNTENNYYYRSNHLYKPSTQQNGVSFQLEQTPMSDSELFYGVINTNNINGDKIYDQNMTMCHTPTTGHANMSTPINPYLAKVSKPFYGVSFINRSRSSSALDLRDNFRSSTKNENFNQTGFNTIYGVEYNEFNPYQRGNYNRSSMHNNTSTAARLIKASKI
jgi:hypothetical protein